ncbi:DUF1697 domain-containing protein [Streptomyces sp. B-S-A8]|uniref:DUF1697 domain-containing protein n=1 Tax=Streptomyces solicavernae TaxID=3043614 RepID=A0ABT6S088_9ACTN|nr:DUF1697 domain-containing protein [Streptomyces sp. B-S-A8]MDI3390102.1 DUF1697 domain-containing protein [Streptomyces sp. B-S-A8]
MTIYAVLLRGINVGGHKKVPMAELRSLLSDMGFAGVRTHLQSGNAVFDSDHGDEDSLAADISTALAEHFGFAMDVLVRNGDYLRAVADACPYPADELEPKQLHVTYFSEHVRPEQLASVDPLAYAPEDYKVGDRALYLYAPDGLGRSKLAPALARPSLMKGVIATSRNWNTVLKLVELTRA